MQEYLIRYAKIILTRGINIKKNDKIFISTAYEGVELAREITKQAYIMGAKAVEVQLNDYEMERSYFKYGHDEIYDEFPQCKTQHGYHLFKDGYHRITLDASPPNIYEGVEPEKLMRYRKAFFEANGELIRTMKSDHIRSTTTMVPSKSWAEKVYPELSDDHAIEALWRDIISIVRADSEDSMELLTEQDKKLHERVDYLNKMKFSKIKFKSSETDISVELNDNHIWAGGSSKCVNGISHFGHVFTKEIYTAPNMYKVNGSVKGSKPFVINGFIVDGFKFEFKDGELIEYSAEKGQEILDEHFAKYPLLKYLGEIALVSNDNAIAKLNKIFYNVAIDENANSHFALGKAIPWNIKDYNQLDETKGEQLGVNKCDLHFDFMIGTDDMSVVGEKEDGTLVEIMKNGTWV